MLIHGKPLRKPSDIATGIAKAGKTFTVTFFKCLASGIAKAGKVPGKFPRKDPRIDQQRNNLHLT